MFNSNLFMIQDYIVLLAQKEEKVFYPQTISRILDIPMDLVVTELNKLISEGLICLKYQIRCNNDLHTLCEVDDFNNILNNSIYCEQCKVESEVKLNDIYPVYYILDEFIEYAKSKPIKQKRQQY